MANPQQASKSLWMPEYLPFLVLVLIAAHVIALVYWIYRLATDKQPQRTKRH